MRVSLGQALQQLVCELQVMILRAAPGEAQQDFRLLGRLLVQEREVGPRLVIEPALLEGEGQPQPALPVSWRRLDRPAVIRERRLLLVRTFVSPAAEDAKGCVA